MAMIASQRSVGKVLDVGDELDAGVVHQDVQRPKLLLSFRAPSRRSGPACEMSAPLIADAHAVFGRKASPQCLDLAGIAEAVQHDVGARRGQRAGDAEPDAAGRPVIRATLPFKLMACVLPLLATLSKLGRLPLQPHK